MPYPYCVCEIHKSSFSDLRINTPKCFYLHMKCLNDLINEGDSCQLKKRSKNRRVDFNPRPGTSPIPL